MTPDQFTLIKNKITESSILSEREKQEWLFLLPKMGPEQLKELDRILSLKLPSSVVNPSPSRPSPRPVTAAPSPAAAGEGNNVGQRPLSPLLPPHPVPKEERAPQPSLAFLTAMSAESMRSSPSIYAFFESITAKIKELRATGNYTTQEVGQAFEKSPLFRTYLAAGNKILEGQSQQVLTQQEFEIVSDFRAGLRKL